MHKRFLSIIIGSLVLASCGGQQGARGDSQTPTLPVITLQPRSTVIFAEYPATLEGHQTVEIRPRVSGYITKMYVDEGAEVHKGEKLFQLNSEEYDQQVRSAKADVEAAKAAVNTASMNLKKTKPLADKDIVSQYDVESAQYNLQSKKAALAQAQANLINAQTNLGYTTVKSPADGVIGNIPYRVGSLVSSNITKPLTVVSDIDKMYAYFSMSERDLLGMMKQAPGNELREKIKQMPPVSFIMADNTLYPHKGSLEIASGLINQSTGSANFRVTFPNPEKLLRSGGSGTIRIPIPKDSVLMVPKKATYDLQNKHFVYLVDKNGKARSTPIQISSVSNAKTYVVTGGLSTGDKIIINGLPSLQDGMQIKPNPVNTDSVFESLGSDSTDL
ncbi:MAG TPA: efflux RND transporter periplasmic adaptor subunit [Balneolaceae bacterium]|nr:efflux RND transporter periplasmic adaptor subunit [Balneolaceae bacterium]